MPGHVVLKSRLDHIGIKELLIIDVLVDWFIAHDQYFIMKTIFVQVRSVIIAECFVI